MDSLALSIGLISFLKRREELHRAELASGVDHHWYGGDDYRCSTP